MSRNNTRGQQQQEEKSPWTSVIGAVAAGAAVAGAAYLAYKVYEAESPAPGPPNQRHLGASSARRTEVQEQAHPPRRMFDENLTEMDTAGREPVCAICTNKLAAVAAKNEDIQVTPCGHMFCYYCLYRWFNTRASCPTCMTPVTLRETTKVFFN